VLSNEFIVNPLVIGVTIIGFISLEHEGVKVK